LSTIIDQVTLLTPFKTIPDSTLITNDEGNIVYAGPREKAPKVEGQRFSLPGKMVIPGLIDIHVHGGNGVNFGEDDLFANLEKYSKWVASGGVTGFLLSIAGPDADSLSQLIAAYAEILDRGLGAAQALGLHLEGPFLNKEKKGAFNPDWLRLPDLNEAKRYVELGRGWVKQVTLAPELPKADEVAELFNQAGVVVALGHSNTDYETASQALKGNFSHITHTYNAQSGFSHRAPGVFGAVLTSDIVTGELIADGVHVHPGAIKLLWRCLGKDRIILITDAIAGAGLPDGEYYLIGQHVTVKDSRATLDDGTIAGSTATLNRCVRNIHRFTDASLMEAVQMASYNPAKLIGRDKDMASLDAGKLANLAVIDENVNVLFTMVMGKIVYNAI